MFSGSPWLVGTYVGLLGCDGTYLKQGRYMDLKPYAAVWGLRTLIRSLDL